MTDKNNRPGFKFSRRHFLALSAGATAGLVVGCATDPITGKKIFMMVSEGQELEIDSVNSPHQFSGDYGTVQDPKLNEYLTEVGVNLAQITHRPDVPYSFRAVNANHVNAYTFPGGTMAATRGILLSMESEAELAALWGHELGHVNARHTSRSMSKSMLYQLFVIGAVAYVEHEKKEYAGLAAGVGMLGSGLLLARYSRANERQADDLGLKYMIKGGYNPKGMIDLMDLLRNISRNKPNVLELMFATHPMGQERYDTAVKALKAEQAGNESGKVNRERYMDNLARLRALKPAIEEMQKGEKAMYARKFDDARHSFAKALKSAPADYTGLLLMAKVMLVREKYSEAHKYAISAEAAYPKEPQAHHVAGMALLNMEKFDEANQEFSSYEQLLPGNPNTVFLQGYSFEGMARRPEAAAQYNRYLGLVPSGEYAQHARTRLVEWGYLEPPEQNNLQGS